MRGRWMAAAALAAGLVGCGRVLAPDSAILVGGIWVVYEHVPEGALAVIPGTDQTAAGDALWLPVLNYCRIRVSGDAHWVVPHEFGHCVDGKVLGGNHNGWGREGGVWGEYFAQPGEGYAEAYSRHFYALYPDELNVFPALGYGAPLQPGPLPDPRGVRPDTSVSLSASYRSP